MAVSFSVLLMEDLVEQAVVGPGGLCLRLETENVLLVEVGVADVRVAGDHGVQDVLGVGLAQDLERGARVDGGIAHREEETQQLQVRIEELSDFVDRLTELDDAVKFEVAGGDGHDDPIGGRQRVEREPRERRRAIDDDVIVVRHDRRERLLEARLAVILGGGELDIRVGEEDVGGDDSEVGKGGRRYRQGLAAEDGREERLLLAKLRVGREQHFRGVRLGVDVDQEGSAIPVRKAGCQRDGGGGFAGSSLL